MIFPSKVDLGAEDYEVNDFDELLNTIEPELPAEERCFWMWPNLESLASNRYKLLLLGLPGAGSSFVKLVLPKSSTLAGAIYDPHIDYSQNTPHIADHRNSGVFFYETPSAPDILVCAANENQARKEDESVAYIMAIFSRDETSPYILKIETGRQDSAASSTSYIPHLDPTVLVRGAAAAALSQARAHNIEAGLYLSLRPPSSCRTPGLDEILAYSPVLKGIALPFEKLDSPAVKYLRNPETASSLYT